VPIHLCRPKYSGDWEEESTRFIDENRWAIVGDLLAILAGLKAELPTYTRWGSWERSVLACVEKPDVCQALIAERQAAIDGDQEDADLVREAFVTALKSRGHDPDKAVVFFKSAEAAKVVNDVGEDKGSPQRVTVYLKTLNIKELRKANDGEGWRGWRWIGKDTEPGQPAVPLVNPAWMGAIQEAINKETRSG
jgi:hypothetical protein